MYFDSLDRPALVTTVGGNAAKCSKSYLSSVSSSTYLGLMLRARILYLRPAFWKCVGLLSRDQNDRSRSVPLGDLTC